MKAAWTINEIARRDEDDNESIQARLWANLAPKLLN